MNFPLSLLYWLRQTESRRCFDYMLNNGYQWVSQFHKDTLHRLMSTLYSCYFLTHTRSLLLFRFFFFQIFSAWHCDQAFLPIKVLLSISVTLNVPLSYFHFFFQNVPFFPASHSWNEANGLLFSPPKSLQHIGLICSSDSDTECAPGIEMKTLSPWWKENCIFHCLLSSTWLLLFNSSQWALSLAEMITPPHWMQLLAAAWLSAYKRGICSKKETKTNSWWCEFTNFFSEF